jgi:hypothetical protein
MYVRGLGQARQPGFVKPGTRIIPVPKLRLIRGRGFGASGSSPTACTSPNYWNSSTGICCAPTGTPPEQDPCSILNSPAFLAAQAQDVGPIAPSGAPVSAGNGSGAAELASIAGYPQNVQQDAENCQTNPGASFVDPWGMTVNCPSASIEQAPGIFVSAYTTAQLAAMLAPTITPSTILPGNAASYTGPAPVPGGAVESTSYSLSVKISGTSFNVGDSWQITVSGPPNSQVSVSGTQNGTSIGSNTPMGTIGSSGTLVLTGTFTASQVGSWTEQWFVAGQSAGSISFSVASGSTSGGASGSSNGGSSGGSSSTGNGASSSDSNPFGFLTNTVTIGGISIPIWALGGGALAALWLMGRK